jgi:drug/metabolite transporter (DMT)-like permease
LLVLPVLGAVLYRATLSVGIGYTLQVWGQKHTPPTDAALILSLESIFAAFSGWLLLNEKLIGVQILGCAFILVAVMLSQFKQWNLRGTIEHDHLVEGR